MTESKMQAVRIHDYGGPEVLVYGEAPRPQSKVKEARQAQELSQTHHGRGRIILLIS